MGGGGGGGECPPLGETLCKWLYGRVIFSVDRRAFEGVIFEDVHRPFEGVIFEVVHRAI